MGGWVCGCLSVCGCVRACVRVFACMRVCWRARAWATRVTPTMIVGSHSRQTVSTDELRTARGHRCMTRPGANNSNHASGYDQKTLCLCMLRACATGLVQKFAGCPCAPLCFSMMPLQLAQLAGCASAQGMSHARIATSVCVTSPF